MVLSGFMEFAKRVIDAAKKGGLKGPDLSKLSRLLTKTGKRSRILAQGILTALSTGGASKGDTEKFSELLELANRRIEEGKTPFTPKQQEELNAIFRRTFISRKTAKWFSSQLDEFVAREINDFISGERKLMERVPEKKTVKFERRAEEKAAKKKVKL